MEMSEELRKLVIGNADATELTRTARAQGMRTVQEDGWDKVQAGVTTVQEVLRVTQVF